MIYCCDMGTRAILVSIRPDFAAAVYTGLKRFEYRRVRMNVRRADRVLVYECRPISKITGEFLAGRLIFAPVRVLTDLEPDPELRRLVSAYLRGASVGTAIEICAPKRWPRPCDLKTFFRRDIAPPVSYRFLSDD